MDRGAAAEMDPLDFAQARDSALYNAKDGVACLRLLLQAGGDPNTPLPGHQWTSLHEIHQILGKCVSDADDPDSEAWMTRCLAYTRMLLDHGADPNRQDAEGNTLLHLMPWDHPKELELARMLLDHGADLRLLNQAGETAVAAALRRSRPLAASWLKKAQRATARSRN